MILSFYPSVKYFLYPSSPFTKQWLLLSMLASQRMIHIKCHFKNEHTKGKEDSGHVCRYWLKQLVPTTESTLPMMFSVKAKHLSLLLTTVDKISVCERGYNVSFYLHSTEERGPCSVLEQFVFLFPVSIEVGWKVRPQPVTAAAEERGDTFLTLF